LPLPTFFAAVDRAGRDEQDVAGLERHSWPSFDLILQRALQDIDDLFARMGVPGGDISRVEVDAYLDDLASLGSSLCEVGRIRTDLGLLRSSSGSSVST